MAGLWEQYPFTGVLSTEGTTVQVELFHNEVDDHIFASAPITIVDGICTINTDNDNLFSVWFIVVNEEMASADVAAISRHERAVWYVFYAVRGPLVFRMKSKKTIFPEEKLWVRIQKDGGNTSSELRGGIQMFMVRHQ